MRRSVAVSIATATAALVTVVSADGAAHRATTVALELCHRAELVGPEVARRLVEEGIREAQIAVERDPEDPVAHFALFCNLGKQIRARGFSLFMVGDLRRLRRALDRSLALDPNYADAVAAKGALLFYTPAIAGGDVDVAERLLRRALEIDPPNPARLVLVDLLIHRGHYEEARRQAETAAGYVRSSEDQRARAGARAVLTHMCEPMRRSDRDRRVLQDLC